MRKCPFCKKDISENSIKCEYCGGIVREIVHSHMEQKKDSTYSKGGNLIYKQIKIRLEKIIRNLSILKLNNFKKYIPIIVFILLIMLVSNQNKTNINTPVNPISVIPINSNGSYLQNNTSPSQEKIKNYIPLSNGTILSKNYFYLKGLGELLIDNGTSYDAIAKLVDLASNKSIFTVYIRANSTYNINNISDGNYKLFFNLGNNWDNEIKAFATNSSYEVFEESFDFITSKFREGDYIQTKYSAFNVTLNPVINGQARTEEVNAIDFGSY